MDQSASKTSWSIWWCLWFVGLTMGTPAGELAGACVSTRGSLLALLGDAFLGWLWYRMLVAASMKSLHPKWKGLPQVPNGRSGELRVGLEVGFFWSTQRCESVIISHPSWILLSHLQRAKCGILGRDWYEFTLQYPHMHWILKNLDHSLEQQCWAL